MNKDWKYQYSQSNGNGGILVARSDTKEDAELDKVWVDTIMGKLPQNNVTQSPTVTQKPIVATAQTLAKDFCSIHSVTMKARIGKEEKVFYSHARQVDGNWEYCNGVSGFASEKRQQVEEAFK